MRQYVMTRSAYGPAWDEETNRRRLDLTRGITVASMAAQTGRDWTWLVALHKDDPLRKERHDLFESAGVPVRFINITSTTRDRSAAAVAAYNANWPRLIGKRDETIAMTRLDDDDALAPWVLDRLAKVAPKVSRRMALVLPLGVRVWNGQCTFVRHESNAMQTLVTLPGDEMHVYGYRHRDVRHTAALRKLDARLAWVWSRHPDTISGWHVSESPIPASVRAAFPIDWSLLAGPFTGGGGPRGQMFR